MGDYVIGDADHLSRSSEHGSYKGFSYEKI